jgi:hypothetical protein
VFSSPFTRVWRSLNKPRPSRHSLKKELIPLRQARKRHRAGHQHLLSQFGFAVAKLQYNIPRIWYAMPIQIMGPHSPWLEGLVAFFSTKQRLMRPISSYYSAVRPLRFLCAGRTTRSRTGEPFKFFNNANVKFRGAILLLMAP